MQQQDSPSTPQTPLISHSLQDSQIQPLPPYEQLETFLQSSPENLISLLPILINHLTQYILQKPEQFQFVLGQLKPIIQELCHLQKEYGVGKGEGQLMAPKCRKERVVWKSVYGDEFIDDYAWLKDKSNPAVLEWLHSENKYAIKALSPTTLLQKVLFREFVSRLDNQEESASVLLGDGYEYFSRKVGKEYKVHGRRRLLSGSGSMGEGVGGVGGGVGGDGFEEEIYLDENQIYEEYKQLNDGSDTKDNTFFNLGFIRHYREWIAYGIDYTGHERYSVTFLNLQTKQRLTNVLKDVGEDFEICEFDGRVWCFYVEIDSGERGSKVRMFKLTDATSATAGSTDGTTDTTTGNTGTTDSNDKGIVIFEEMDEMFYVTLTKSCNQRYLFINTSAQITSETLYLDLYSLSTSGTTTTKGTTSGTEGSSTVGTEGSSTVKGGTVVKPKVLFKRMDKVQYSVEHHCFGGGPTNSTESTNTDSSTNDQGCFYFITNEGGLYKNHVLYRLKVPPPLNHEPYESLMECEDKQLVVGHRDFVLLESFQVREKYIILFERTNCIQNIRIIELSRENPDSFDTFHYLPIQDQVYSLFPLSVDPEIAELSKQTLYYTNTVRYTYTSFIQPKQLLDYDIQRREIKVLSQERVLGPWFDMDLYVQKRVWAMGEDGTAIPISLVYRRDLCQDETGGVIKSPLLMHGYGAYGSCMQPIFSTNRLSLLDRGFVYAIAHVRGGSELGNAWYHEGKLHYKNNTFLDFIKSCEYLIQEGYTSPQLLSIYGRSAGGLLVGSVVNRRPELFKSCLVEVPFVDVLNTMFDSGIPWTAFEFEEWGDPSVDRVVYEEMKKYCPYENVGRVGGFESRVGGLESGGRVKYPNMLIVAGMNDPRVAYFEPAKWTAKLRERCWFKHSPYHTTTNDTTDNTTNTTEQNSTTTDGEESDRLLLLRIQESGHSGSSGQFSHLHDLAYEYAFLISTLGARFRPPPYHSSGVGGAGGNTSSGSGRVGGTISGVEGVGAGVGKEVSLSGEDYDMYWREGEQEQQQEEQEVESVGIGGRKSLLGMIGSGWRRMSRRSSSRPGSSRSSQKGKKKVGLSKSLGGGKEHKRSGSFYNVLLRKSMNQSHSTAGTAGTAESTPTAVTDTPTAADTPNTTATGTTSGMTSGDGRLFSASSSSSLEREEGQSSELQMKQQLVLEEEGEGEGDIFPFALSPKKLKRKKKYGGGTTVGNTDTNNTGNDGGNDEEVGNVKDNIINTGGNDVVVEKGKEMKGNGSKASLRHLMYPQEEEGGRVQSAGRVYQFLSKFF